MPRFRPALVLFLLLVLLALPASAVTSKRTSRNSGWSFFSAFWGAITSLLSTDGRCGLDPDGQCLPG